MSIRSLNLRAPGATALILLLASCGGGGGSVSGPSGGPPAGPTHSVVVVAFYDENGNGSADVNELVKVPGVEIEVAGRTGRAEKGSGRATIAGVREGTHPVTVRAATLPPYYRVGQAVTVQSPQPAGQDVMVPLTLPLGPRNRPNTYLAFGDSITSGEGSVHVFGYADTLARLLQQHSGPANVLIDGQSGTRSDKGANRIDASLRENPAYVLILYGTNDWNRSECKSQFPCDVVQNLRFMVTATRERGGLPIVGTIPPVNPGNTNAPERNEWVTQMNTLIRAMAREERAPVADVNAALVSSTSLADLFTDHVHPNDRGYEIMAGEFFKAITTPLPQ